MHPSASLRHQDVQTVLTIACVCVLLAVPWLFLGHFPLVDLPQHLGTIAVLAHPGDPRWADFFTINLQRTSYLAFYLPAAALTPWLGVEAATHLITVLTIASPPVAVARLLRAYQRPALLGALVAPAAIHTWVLAGFINFLMGVSFSVLALASLADVLHGKRRAWMLCVFSLLTFYAHPQMYLWLGMGSLIAVVAAARPQGWPSVQARVLRAVVAMVPSGLAAVWWVVQSNVLTRGEVARGPAPEGGLTFWNPMEPLANWRMFTTNIYTDGSDLPLVSAYLLVVAALVVVRVRQREKGARTLEWLLGLTVLLYVFGPINYRGIQPLSQRFISVALLLVPVLGPRVLTGRMPKAVMGAAIVLAMGTAALHTPNLLLLEQELGDIDEALARTQPGRRLIGINMDPWSQVVRAPTALHTAHYYQALVGGHASWGFSETAKSPIQYRAGAAPPEFPAGFAFKGALYDHARFGSYFDYFLVRQPQDVRLIPFPPSADAPELLYDGKRWQLYAKRAP